jgi:fumarate reductase subunit D
LHAVLWGIFSAGGFIAAFFLPILVYLVGIAYPLGLWPVASNDPTHVFVLRRLGVLFIFVTVAGSLFHGVFRFQSTLVELGLKKYGRAIEAVGYFVIATGIIVLVYYLLRLDTTFFNFSL